MTTYSPPVSSGGGNPVGGLTLPTVTEGSGRGSLFDVGRRGVGTPGLERWLSELTVVCGVSRKVRSYLCGGTRECVHTRGVLSVSVPLVPTLDPSPLVRREVDDGGTVRRWFPSGPLTRSRPIRLSPGVGDRGTVYRGTFGRTGFRRGTLGWVCVFPGSRDDRTGCH